MIEKPLCRYGELDAGSLCRLFRQPDIYVPSADDNTRPEDIQRFIDNCLASPMMYVLGRNPKQEAFIFAPSHNSTCYQAHFAVTEALRDGSVVRKTAEAGQWMFNNTTCKSIISYMRRSNVAARSVLSQVGLTRSGMINDSVSFAGKMEDELIYYGTIEDFKRLWPEMKLNQ